MALNSTAVGEVRPGLGSDTNGGFYDSSIGVSTDYSQQNAPQLSLADVVTNGTTTVTSATGGFTAAMLGNGFNLAGTICIILGVTNTNTITIDRTIVTGSGQTGKVGGALSTPGYASGQMVGGNVIYVRSSALSPVTSATNNISGGCMAPPAGTVTMPTKFIGYQNTRGDNGTPPQLQASGISSFAFVTIAATGNTRIENIWFDGNNLAASRGVTTLAATTGSVVSRCKFTNMKNSAIAGATTALAVLCEATGCSNSAVYISINCIACTAHDNTVTGFSISTVTSLQDCISCNNTGASSDGFFVNGVAALIENCTAYGNGRDGFRGIAFAGHNTFINCIAENNLGYGFNASAQYGHMILTNCGGYNNTSSLVNMSFINAPQQVNMINATDEIFNNPGGNDFSLNFRTNGGALFRAAGIPGSTSTWQLPGLSTPSYLDVGAVQHQDTQPIIRKRVAIL
jgi:hypothetical protein